MTQILNHVDESGLVSLSREIIINIFSVQKIMNCVLHIIKIVDRQV